MVHGYLIWGLAAFVVVCGLIAGALLQRESKRELRAPDQIQTLGMVLVVLGIVFGEDPLLGYSLIGVGVLLSAVSLVVRRRRIRS